MSYNLLAPSLVAKHQYLYRNCQPKWLDWEVRSCAILLDVGQRQPDILCLQELDQHIYHDPQSSFRIGLKSLGYNVHFYQKRLDEHSDGVAIFLKRRFRVLASQLLSYRSLDPELNKNVAIILRLEDTKDSRRKLYVTNTHLLWNPNQGIVKLRQLQVLVEATRSMYQQYGDHDEASTGPTVPILMCGDYNFTMGSPIWNWAVSESPNFHQIPRSALSGQKDAKKPRQLPDGSLCHNELLSIESIPKPLDFALTCFIPRSKAGVPAPRGNKWMEGVVDFIFYGHKKKGGSDPGIRPVQWLLLPRITPMLFSCRSLPNHAFPSDHVPLMGRFAFM